MLCPPEHAHQIVNTGLDDLLFYVVADNPPAEVTFYPETGRWGIKPHKKHFKMQEAEYYEPED